MTGVKAAVRKGAATAQQRTKPASATAAATKECMLADRGFVVDVQWSCGLCALQVRHKEVAPTAAATTRKQTTAAAAAAAV